MHEKGVKTMAIGNCSTDGADHHRLILFTRSRRQRHNPSRTPSLLRVSMSCYAERSSHDGGGLSQFYGAEVLRLSDWLFVWRACLAGKHFFVWFYMVTIRWWEWCLLPPSHPFLDYYKLYSTYLQPTFPFCWCSVPTLPFLCLDPITESFLMCICLVFILPSAPVTFLQLILLLFSMLISVEPSTVHGV